MSHALGVVRFHRTGNVYVCRYNGTSDIMYPKLWKVEEIKDENGRWNVYDIPSKDEDWPNKRNEEPEDIDDIDIWTDYGNGFSWSGRGSETLRQIWDGQDWDEIIEGIPEWAKLYIAD